MRRRIFCFITIALLFFGANFLVSKVGSQTKPFTLGQILRALSTPSKNKPELLKRIINDVKSRGVGFALTAEVEMLLRNEGATDEFIESVRQKSSPVIKPPATPLRTPTATPVPTPTPTPVRTPTAVPVRIPALSNISKTFKNSLGMEFVRIPNGSFKMGSNDGEVDENPMHRVTISNIFYIGKYEVTQEEYEKLMKTNPSGFKSCPRCPVENVSWDDAQDFIKRLNAKNEGIYRLPTEAEWEYAARGGKTTTWSFGKSESKLGFYAWYSQNSVGKTHEVGMKQSNAFGLYDMNGNVWEWCEDWLGSYSSDAQIDPQGTSSGTNRVNRGGSWDNDAGSLRSSFRNSNSPSNRYTNLGFRLVRQ